MALELKASQIDPLERKVYPAISLRVTLIQEQVPPSNDRILMKYYRNKRISTLDNNDTRLTGDEYQRILLLIHEL